MATTRQCKTCPVGGKFRPADGSCSINDPNDGLPVMCVSEWAEDKHEKLTRYVDISKAARRKFANRAGACFIDLFSGPGRCRIKGTDRVIDGGVLAAVRAGNGSGVAFSHVFVGDISQSYVEACVTRLNKLGTSAVGICGPAVDTVGKICGSLPESALNVAFLDPYNLGALPFQIIQKLSRQRRMDLLIHVSTQDLQRNLEKYIGDSESPLDQFAPDWRSSIIPTSQSKKSMRLSILKHWIGLFRGLDIETADGIERVTGPKNQNLYWLVFAARSELANNFWEAIRNTSKQQDMFS